MRQHHTLSNSFGHALKPVAFSVLLGFGGMTFITSPVQATEQLAEYHIPAGDLVSSINRFAQEAGVSVLMEAKNLSGIKTKGLSGKYSIDGGFAQLLIGSGYKAIRTKNGFLIEAAPIYDDGQQVDLSAISVDADTLSLGLTTENSGSYTSGAMSTGTGLVLSQRQTPQSVSVVTRQQIEDQNLNDVMSVLEQTPGVVVNTVGPVGSDGNSLYVRGFEIRSIQVDGVNRSSSYGFNDELADMVTYDHVEVVRGATGLMSGIGDPGATVNLVRKKPTRETQRSLTLKAGSWDNYRSELDISGSLSESGDVRGRFVTAYQDSQSYIDRQSMDKQVAYGVLEWDITDDTMLTLGAEYNKMDNDGGGNHGFAAFNSDGSRFKPSRSFNSAADWGYHDRENKVLFGTLEHSFDNGWIVKFNAEHSRRMYDDAFATAASGTVNPDGSGLSTWTGRWAAEPRQTSFDLSASGKFTLFNREHDLYLGASHYKAYHRSYGYPLWTIQSIDNIYTWDGSLPVPSAIYTKSNQYAFEEEQTALLASARWSLTDALSLITGTRVIDWQRDESSYTFSTGAVSRDHREENGVLTPYLGLVYDLNDNWSVYASYSTIFNPQDYMDANGSYLEPEEGVNYELGIKSELWDKRLNLAFSVFEVQQDNLAVADGSTLAPNGDQAYRAESDTKTRGFELEVAGEILPLWQVSASYTYSEIHDADDDRLLTDMPRDTFKIFTSYQIASLNNLKIGGSVRWQGEEYMKSVGPNGEDFTQDDFTVVDLMAQYPLSPDLSIAVNLNNVFDKEYYTYIGSRAWYGAPRNATATIKYMF